MLPLVQIAVNKLYKTATTQNVNNAPKSQKAYVYKPYRTLNNY